MKKLLLFITMITMLLLAGCSTAPEKTPFAEGKLPVAVSFHAMDQLAKAIGGDYVDIHVIIPDGEEPHDFQPKASDLTALAKARVLVLNGGDLENWAEKAVASSGNKDLLVVTAADGADLIHVEGEGHDHHHDDHGIDSHVWLSPQNAKIEARHVCDAFSKADPDHADKYEQNYQAFASSIDEMVNEYKGKFEKTQRKSFVTGHAAFAYLARDFGLTQYSVTDVFASGEPSARQLAELTEQCKKDGIHTVFIEEMDNPKVSETLAKEIGASIETIDTMESGDPEESYLTAMRANLEKIYQSLL